MSLNNFLRPTYFFDFESEQIQQLIAEFDQPHLSEKQKAIGLYNKVRDGWIYNPHHISFNPESLKASNLFTQKEGHCIDKSILLIAGLRRLGIPAKLHLAKVKNHLAVEKLTEKFGTNELTPHGMVDIYLKDQWLKVSPAFNSSLCEKCQVAPLEFDGENDSLFQEYNKANQQFMEYTDDYGSFDDVPVAFILDNMQSHYPHIFSDKTTRGEFNL